MDVELKEDNILHLVFASLPKVYDNFVVNYNMNIEKWDVEKIIVMCVQVEKRMKTARGDSGSINYVNEGKGPR